MTSLASPVPARQRVRAAVPPLVVAGAALLLGLVAPLLSPLLTAMLVGAVIANSRLHRYPWLTSDGTTTRLLLRLGVVLVGLRLPVDDVLAIGLPGVLVIVGTVSATYWLTCQVGRRMDLDRGFVAVLAAGFAICGAAAIATVSDAVRARQRDVALAVALVTIYGSALIVAIPWLAGLLGLDDDQAAVWAGASIHEVAQVAVTASILGGGAVGIAMTVKLGRVALLAPLYVLVARGKSPDRPGAPMVPWFVVGFAVAVAVRSTLPLPDLALSVANTVTTLLLGAGMFGLGTGLRVRDLWPIPPAALLLATASTAVAAGVSLTLVVLVL
ncbi:putative sulfate exporter family transporter [Nocardioides hungaricus]